MPSKRERTVEGSCWPCKQRRVKCDIQKPSCRKCILAGSKCNYDKILIRWKARPTKGAPLSHQNISPDRVINPLEGTIATNERRALDYFEGRVWPLFSTSTDPCPPPLRLALHSRPVLLATCVLADAHRAAQDERNNRDNLQLKRLDCLSAIRQTIGASSSQDASLSLLVAVLLLYFLDGYVECTLHSASTESHHAGAKAIIESLGGFSRILGWKNLQINMLLSEYVSTDLTSALLRGKAPSFSSEIWAHLDITTVWWEKHKFGMESMATVFTTLSEMAWYRETIKSNENELLMEKVQEWDSLLQPKFPTLNLNDLLKSEDSVKSDAEANPAIFSHALYRAFQHSALLYLYRAICYLPSQHDLVQQHVLACLECVMISGQSKAQNCALFPLYVAGAHAFSEGNQRIVLEVLDSIYRNLKFEAVLAIRSALEDLWASSRQLGTWTDMFMNLQHAALVL